MLSPLPTCLQGSVVDVPSCLAHLWAQLNCVRINSFLGEGHNKALPWGSIQVANFETSSPASIQFLSEPLLGSELKAAGYTLPSWQLSLGRRLPSPALSSVLCRAWVLFCPGLPPLSWRRQFFTPLPSGIPPSFPTYKGHPRLSHLAMTTNISSQTSVVLLATSRQKWVWHHFKNLTLLCDRKSIRPWCQGT